MDLDILYKQILKRDFKYAKVSKGNHTKLLLSSRDYTPFTAQEIVNELKLYFNDFPDTYKIMFKVKPTDKIETATIYEKVIAGDYTEVIDNRNIGYSETDIKKIREEIRKDLVTELTEAKRKNDIEEEYKAQKLITKDLDTVVGKISYLFNAFINNSQLANGKLAGNNDTTNMTTEPKDLNNFTQEDKDKANESLMRLLTVTNPDFLLEIANKLQEKPQLISTIKNFI